MKLGGFIERVGAALVAPRIALGACDGPDSAGRTGGDAALLLALVFVATHTRELVAAVWVGAAESVRVGLNALFAALSRAVAMELAVLFASAVLLTLLVGRKRELGRDFDLACVAFVPLIAVKLSGTLLLLVTGLSVTTNLKWAFAVVAYGWAAAVLFMAWQTARARPDAAAEGAAAADGDPTP